MISPAADPDAGPALERAKKLFGELQNGDLDRTLISRDLSAYFTDEAIADFSASLKPLGPPESFTAAAHSERGGMTYRSFSIKTARRKLGISTFVTRDGKFAQFLVTPAN